MAHALRFGLLGPVWLLAALATGCGGQSERITVDVRPAALVRSVPARRAPGMLASPTGPCLSLDEWRCHTADEDPTLEWSQRCRFETEEVDIDGAPPMDLIANIGDCSNRGVCDHLVLQGCESGGYRVLLGPIVTDGLHVLRRSPQSPVADLLTYEHRCGDYVELLEVHRWNGAAWSQDEGCAIEEYLREYREGGGDTGCSAGTPVCAAELERDVKLLWERRRQAAGDE